MLDNVIEYDQSSFTTDDPVVTVPLDLFERTNLHANYKNRLTAIDLFAGAGGFSLGFEAAGFGIKTCIEIDGWACETLRQNHPETNVSKTDIANLSDKELGNLCSHADVIIGGPPCQGFSIANRRARTEDDPRNSLFQHFIRAAEICQPQVLLLENVPGLRRKKTSAGIPYIEVIKEEFDRIGYHVFDTIAFAQDYGVPQIRPRLFVIGYKSAPTASFPKITHSNANGSAYDMFDNLKPHTSMWSAIGDLPTIEARQGDEEMEYDAPATNDLQTLLRAGSSKLYNHKAMKHSKRLVERFSQVRWGGSGADVVGNLGARKRSNADEVGKVYDQNNRRPHPTKPSHTLAASFYANFIHPFSNRNFTPREGARLQTFPDWYRFSGKPTVVSRKLLQREGRSHELFLCQYNQIGNAVPPLLAYNFGKHIAKCLS